MVQEADGDRLRTDLSLESTTVVEGGRVKMGEAMVVQKGAGELGSGLRWAGIGRWKCRKVSWRPMLKWPFGGRANHREGQKGLSGRAGLGQLVWVGWGGRRLTGRLAHGHGPD